MHKEYFTLIPILNIYSKDFERFMGLHSSLDPSPLNPALPHQEQLTDVNTIIY